MTEPTPRQRAIAIVPDDTHQEPYVLRNAIIKAINAAVEVERNVATKELEQARRWSRLWKKQAQFVQAIYGYWTDLAQKVSETWFIERDQLRTDLSTARADFATLAREYAALLAQCIAVDEAELVRHAALMQENVRLREDLERAECALAPFAAFAAAVLVGNDQPDDRAFYRVNGVVLTFGDLRAALAQETHHND